MSKDEKIPAGFTLVKSENPFGKLTGPFYEKKDEKGWVRGFHARKEVTNRAGVVHGGQLMTFADIILSRAVLDVAPLPFATVQMECKFISPALEGEWVEGRAHVIRRTKTLAFVECDISSRDKPVFRASAIFRLLKG